MSITNRDYLGDIDDQYVRGFLSRTYAATRHPFYSVDPPNWERIRVNLGNDSGKRSLRLWELEERPSKMVVGMAIYEKQRSQFSYLVHPNYAEIEDQIVEWVEKEHGEVKADQGEKVVLKCSVCEANEEQKIILTRWGYKKGKIDTVFRRRSLDEVSSETITPKGYRIQDVQSLPGELLSKRALVESKALGSTITVEFLQALQGAPIYRPELDLVMTTPDGGIAAFCTAWIDDFNRVGFIEPIGTAAAHRRQGLAKALLLEGFRRLRRLGAELAYLGHGIDNRAGIRLYEPVGLMVFDQECLWHKEL